MVTNQFTRDAPLNESLSREALTIIERLQKKQVDILADNYRVQTGNLSSVLSSQFYQISVNNDGIDIRMDYPATIRFLDLRFKNKSGKKKPNYTAIYNRPLFGHIFGSGYSLTNVINLAVHNRIFNFFENLRTVQKDITL